LSFGLTYHSHSHSHSHYSSMMSSGTKRKLSYDPSEESSNVDMFTPQEESFNGSEIDSEIESKNFISLETSCEIEGYGSNSPGKEEEQEEKQEQEQEQEQESKWFNDVVQNTFHDPNTLFTHKFPEDVLFKNVDNPRSIVSSFLSPPYFRKVKCVYASDEKVRIDDMNEYKVIGHLIFSKNEIPGMMFPNFEASSLHVSAPLHVSTQDILQTFNRIGLSEEVIEVFVKKEDKEDKEEAGCMDVMFEMERYTHSCSEDDVTTHMRAQKLDLTRVLALANEVDGLDFERILARNLMIDVKKT